MNIDGKAYRTIWLAGDGRSVEIIDQTKLPHELAIVALETLRRPMRVVLFTDSQYLRQGITEWIEGWRARGWRTADKKPVKNQDLWERLDAARSRHRVEWRWLKGHAGHELNERADELARKEIKQLRQA